MTLGKCPYSARWLHWGLPSPEQISGTCAAFLAGLPPSQPYHSPLLCGANPQASEDWLALAKAAARVSWEPPRPSPGAEGKGQQVGLPGFELLCSYLEQRPGGGGVGWPGGGALFSFTLGSFFLLVSSSQLLL